MRMCAIEGCNRNAKARGWCELHYRRWAKTLGPGGVHSVPRRDIRIIDMAGMVFHNMTVIKLAPRRIRGTYWLCRCICGNEREVLRGNLVRGGAKSCGCKSASAISAARTTHGKRNTNEYKIWAGMKNRCLNSDNPAFKYYGGRGIKVCQRWMKFENFFADMGRKPAGKSLDRINNDGNYEPGNCRWATSLEQHRNQRTNRRIEFNGERLLITEWARRFSLDKSLLTRRIRKFGEKKAMELGGHLFYKTRRVRNGSQTS
jgi:hypothetical protein